MKTLLVTMISITLSLGVSAQRKGGYYHAYHPRVIVSPSIGFGLGYGYGYPYLGYPYYGYPYGYGYPYNNRRTPYKLSLEIQSIKVDYQNQIRDARHNKSLSHSQRRQEIRTLKGERQQAIITAEKNFRYNGSNGRSYNNQNQAPNQSPKTDNQYQDNGSNSSGTNP